MTAAEGPHPQKTGRAACARGQAPTNCWEAGDWGGGHPRAALHAPRWPREESSCRRLARRSPGS